MSTVSPQAERVGTSLHLAKYTAEQIAEVVDAVMAMQPLAVQPSLDTAGLSTVNSSFARMIRGLTLQYDVPVMGWEIVEENGAVRMVLLRSL